MNEQLLKFIYDGSEKDGFALVGVQYKAMVDELVDSELVEVDPDGAQPDGSYRVTVTEDGIKWVEAGQTTAKAQEAPAPSPAPSRPRGRPRKAAAMEVISQGPVEVIESELVDEPLPFVSPFNNPFNGPDEQPVPAWGDKIAQQPAPFVSPFVSPFDRKEMSHQHGLLAINAPAWSRPSFDVTPSSGDVFADIGIQKPAWSRPSFDVPANPHEATEEPAYDETEFVDHPTLPQPLAEAFKPMIEAEKPVAGPLRPRREMAEPIHTIVESYIQSDNVYKQTPSVGITTHLLPPTKRVRVKAEDTLAPWPQFAQMPVYGQFYLTEGQEADGFDKVLSTANRVYGKQTPPKTFQMFEAKKVQNANTTVGFYVFRMS